MPTTIHEYAAGDRVRILYAIVVNSSTVPDVLVRSLGTVVEVRPHDTILVHPDGWPKEDVYPLGARDLELVSVP